MPDAESYPYIYVNADGTARELHPDERRYLETEFAPGDSGMPYVKCSYDQRNGWGEIRGFLERAKLPDATPIHEAPKENPNRPLNRAEFIEQLRGRGAKVIENSDGSITVSGPRLVATPQERK